MPNSITFAHLSDVHLGPVAGFSPLHWNVKRALGFINWQRKRRYVHRRGIADRLIADIHRRRPDHIVITGDLINLGLPSEYELASAWLTTVGPPDAVSIVPGNHDVYTRLRGSLGIGHWQPYMKSDGWGVEQGGAKEYGFPFLRRVGSVAIIGLCSAVPTPPAVASGRLGAEQIRSAQDILTRVGALGLFRLVLIHHPPLPGQASRTRGLADAAEFARVLGIRGAELILHGHNHRDMLAEVAYAQGSAPVVGVASASAGVVHDREPLARYNLYRIADESNGWSIEMIGLGLAEPNGPIVELERRVFALHRAVG